MMFNRFWKIAAVLTVALAGCAEPPPPTTVQLTANAAADINGGLPTKVKVYYLRSAAKFNTADFFAVFDQPEATLGPDLVAVDEYLMAPGKNVEDAKSFDLAPTAVGVVAAFRDIGQPGWRAVGPLKPNAANPVAVTFAGNSVEIAQ